MKKKWNCLFPANPGKWLKRYWMMRNFIILFFVCNLGVMANGFTQEVSVAKYNNATLLEVFDHLKEETGYGILYKEYEINPDVRVNMNLEDSNVHEVLNEALEGTGLTYIVQDEVIVVYKAEVLPQPVIEEAEQEKKILTGQVTDDQGVPLPGVSVLVKGTSTGVATDIDGNYSIEIQSENVVLVFSFVGMMPQEIAFTGQIVQNVTLTADTEQMAEVVVTGYQTISKERATGSFSVLSSENVSNSPNETIGDNLESLVAGVQTSTDENGDLKITIRGATSLTGEEDPLIVVDGFAVEGGFESINRNDIDKITVLKDAAAASIWGARAANGVIVITTKRGKKLEGLQVEVEAYTKFSEDINLDYANPIASSESQLLYEKYMWENLNPLPSLSLADIYTATTLGNQIFQNQKLNDGVLSMDTPEIQKLINTSYKDQVKDLMLRKASSQNYNVSIRGQGEKNSYALSVMYNKNNGIMQEDTDDNILINFRNRMKIRDWMELDFSVMNQIKNYNSGGVGLSDIKQMSAYETLLDENGNYNNIITERGLNYGIVEQLYNNTTGWPYQSMINNPLQNMRSQDFNTKTINSRINAGLNIKIAEGIKYSAGFQYENNDIDIKNRYKEDSYFTRSTVNEFAVTDYTALTEAFEGGTPYQITDQQIANGEIVYLQNTKVKSYLIRNQLSLNKTFGKHSFNMIAGSELNWNTIESKDDWLYGYDHDHYTNVIPKTYTGLARAYQNNQTRDINRGGVLTHTKRKFFSLYSNLAYTYNDKYTLSGSIRTDASNITVDDPKYRYQPFWSVGASWQIAKEDFMESYDWVNRLILRATYGVNGNIPISTAQVPLIDYTQGGSFYSAGEDWARITDLGNPSLSWEQVKQMNLALDFALFGNKLFGSLEVYNKKSEDLVAKVALPSTDGTSSQSFNVAEMTNKGIELSLSANLKLAKDLNWRPTLNFAHNDNKVESVNIVALPLYDLLDTDYVEGYAYSPVWGYKLGEPDENGIPTIIGKNGVTYSATAPIGNSGEFGPDVVWNRGSRIAPTIASLTNEFTYKGFSLLTTFTGKFGHVVNRYYDPVNTGFSYNTRNSQQNYNKDLNQIIAGNASEIGMFDLPDQPIVGYENLGVASYLLESNVVSGSHIRFKEIMLSYKLPKSFISKMKILQGAKVYAHVRNVGIIWKKNDCGIDPDYPMGYIKPERTYTLGLNLKF